jgi:hypothetical protein
MKVHLRAMTMVLCVAVAATLSASPFPIVIPSGTPIHFKLLRTIATATAQAGDHVPAELTSPIVIDGHTVANAGAPAVVRIRDVEASGRIGGSAKLTFTLSSLTFANGKTFDVRTSSYSREGKAHAKHNAEYIVGGAIVGALAGQALGHDSRSTERGTAIGAGVGIGAAAATGKFDFEETAGSRYRLTLRSSIRTTL